MIDPNELVLMKHPTIPDGEPGTAPYRSFKDVWEGKGWELVEPVNPDETPSTPTKPEFQNRLANVEEKGNKV